jgi:hypothetical protein
MTYTWSDHQVANAILMKFDLSGIPAGTVVQAATLYLALVQSDGAPEATYTVTAHKVVGKNPVIAAATGYTADGATSWTPNACCYNNVPLAQADISPAYDTRAIDKTSAYKAWTITAMVQEWLAAPATNLGLLLNSDPSKLRDSYRYFASMEHPDSTIRPFLHITYALPPSLDGTPPTVSVTTPAAGATVSGVVTIAANASDDVGVAGVQFQLDGSPLGAEATVAPYAVSWNTTAASQGTHTLTALARDAAGNVGTAAGVIVTVANDTTPPLLSGVTASSITSSGTTISWTTDEASDSQVEYGPTTAYGSATTLNPSLVASHLVTLSGLADTTLNHFRVWSRDAAGNLATSADFTFATLDGTPPAVSIAAPTAGATVSGTVTVVASATDNVGVVGVQFKLDGADLGAEATLAPYAVAWNTTAVPNGPHTLSAVARDAAGNISTAAGVIVTVANDTTPPLLSGVTASSITTSGTTISWTTDEASDSQVEYGPTTTYGSATTLNGSLLTSHVVTLGGLAANTLYHFRVRSWDAAGNLAMSGDFTFTTLTPDLTAPAVSISAPSPGSTVAGRVTVAASATDDVGVAGVQFQLDGASLGVEVQVVPYVLDWDTTTVPDGTHTLTAVARDAAGNSTTSAAVSVTVANGSFRLSPQDTSLVVNATNYSTDTRLMTYTWSDHQVANAILMKFDLSGIPAGAVVQAATLYLALVESDGAPEATYTVTAHKVVGTNPVIAAATGYTTDGVTSWTPSACCYNNVPLAQADISPAYDTRAIDKTPGYKSWTITAMVQEWLANPTTNFGLLLNADISKLRDRYRYFASMEHPNAKLRPYLKVTYSVATSAFSPASAPVVALREVAGALPLAETVFVAMPLLPSVPGSSGGHGEGVAAGGGARPAVTRAWCGTSCLGRVSESPRQIALSQGILAHSESS